MAVVRVLVLIALLAGEFAVLEASLRWYGSSEASPGFQSLFMDDDQVGHRLRPNAHARYTTVEFSTDLKINAQGVRDDQDIGPKAAHERRVVILGDSLALSVQVPLQETFGKRLEARLNAAGGPDHWRVINAGVQGYSPVEEWLFYDHVAAAFEPDVVLVLAFVGNDAVEAYDRESWIDAGHPPLVSASDRAMTRFRRYTRSSMVLQYIRLRVDLLRSKFSAPVPERPLVSYATDPPVEVTHGLEVTRRAVDLIAKRAAAGGARTAIALMPARFQTDDEDFGRLQDIVETAGGTIDRNSASRRFASALAPLGLPMIDLQPALAAQPDRARLFFQRNIHLTPRGHDVVARTLFDFFEASGLATPPPS
ncbi:MAG TPA: hypothetical protein VLT86_09450 [Vicinamibacterales bacterium]|nr:hypothetical protein [Vicinamibacterales bacterium]